MKKKFRISQSMIKDYTDYKEKKFCGTLFDALWISRTHRKDPTDAMLLGQWFEYLALGPWGPGNAERFSPGMKAAGKKHIEAWEERLMDPWETIPTRDLETHFTAKYVNLFHQAKHLRNTFEAWEIEILDLQLKKIWDLVGYERTMVWDVYAQVNKMPDPDHPGEFFKPHRAIIDVKATGLINNGWEDYGWDVNKLPFKKKLIIQPIDYMDQVREYPDLPVEEFYFFVHSNTNDWERKVIHVPVHEGLLDQHRQDVSEMAGELDFLKLVSFKPYPSLAQCRDCPLRNECPERAHHPRVRVVNLI